MLGFYSDRYQTTTGDAVNATITVKFVGAVVGDPVPSLYSWDGSAYVSLANNQVTSVDGYFEFYCTPGIYKVTAGTDLDKNICVGVPSVPFGFVDAQPDAFLATSDHTALIQAEIDRVSAWAQTVKVGGTVYLGARTYIVSNIVLPNNTSLEGAGPSVTILKQKPGSAGHVVSSISVLGSNDPNGGKHSIRNLGIDGQATRTAELESSPDNGIVRVDNLDVDSTKNNLGRTDWDTTAFHLRKNYYVEAMGLPVFAEKIDIVQSHRVKLQTPALWVAQGVNVAFRRAWSISVTLVASQATVVTYIPDASSEAPTFQKGMRLEGKWGDEDVWIVEIISPTKFRVQRPDVVVVSDTGVYDATVSIYNCGIFVGEPVFYNAGNYSSDLEYRAPLVDNVVVVNCSGDGLVCRPGRDQLHVTNGTQMFSNYGAGWNLNSANDCQIEGNSRSLNNWRQAVAIRASATPRIIGCTVGLSVLRHKVPEVDLFNLAQVSMVASTVLGTVEVTGQIANPSQEVRLSGVNFEWSVLNNVEYAPYVAAFIKVIGTTQVVLDSPSFSGDGSPAGRPMHLWNVLEASTSLLVDNLPLITGSATAPYSVAMGAGLGKIYGMYVDLSAGERKWLGIGPRLMGVVNGSVAPQGAVGEVVALPKSTPTTPVTSSVAFEICQLSQLAIGDWEISGCVNFSCTLNSGFTVSSLRAAINNSVAIPVSTPVGVCFDESLNGRNSSTLATWNLSLVISPFRVSNSVSTTWSLIGAATYSGTGTGAGVTVSNAVIRARRVR